MGLKDVVRSWFGNEDANQSPEWREGIPRLYPDHDETSICEFLNDDEYRRIRQLPLVMICPSYRDHEVDDDTIFACGLTRLLIRNLMLLPSLSIRGSEDTPLVQVDQVQELLAQKGQCDAIALVGTDLAQGRARVAVFRSEGENIAYDITADDLPSFLMSCTQAMAQALGATPDERILNAWKRGQPTHEKSLHLHGELVLGLHEKDSAEGYAAWREDPSYSSLLWDLIEDPDDHLGELLEGLEHDPDNSQICFRLFCSVWLDQKPEPEAMQFCRRAIELSPGHGKAHMCAPHAADPQVDMYRHSELGYHLLPGNPFAIDNYISYLEANGGDPHRLLELVNDGIAADPCDPRAYEQAIEICSDLKDFTSALDYARRLAELYGPPINPRTQYCIEQNPVGKENLRSGVYVPHKEHAKVVRELELLVEAGEVA